MTRRSRSPQADEAQTPLFALADESPEEAAANDENRIALLASTGSLKKPVETIFIRPKKGKLNLLDSRFFNALLRHAQEHPDSANPYFRIALSQFKADVHYTSRNREHLVEVLNHMMGTVVNWGDSPRNAKGDSFVWQGAPLITYARISKKPGTPEILEYEFQRELLSQLLNPRVYATINIDLAAKANTYAAHKLLEICERYKTSPNGLSARLHWREWVTLLTGEPEVGPDVQFKYFSRDVLYPAVKQVNEIQDAFEVRVLLGKVGRRVETLQILVRRKGSGSAAPAVPLQELATDDLELVGRMLKLGIPQDTAEGYVHRFRPPRVRAALEAMETRLQKNEPVDNPIAYFVFLLNKGNLKDDQAVDVTAVERPNAPVETDRLKLVRRDYEQAMKDKAFAVFQELPLHEQVKQYDDYEATALPNEKSDALRRSWRNWRAETPDKPIPRFVQPGFKAWLATKDLQADDSVVLNWGVQIGHPALSAAKPI